MLEILNDLRHLYAQALRDIVDKLEFRRMFNNPMDPSPCFLEIQAGAGGTEAQDWASMLLRMYLKFGEKKGFTVEVMEESEGEVAGIKGATVKFTGDYAYGTLRTETGIHRLVRKSPFDSAARRHTSFTSVFVFPEVDDSIEININPADVRTDTYRASGAGGQHINKTDSAVRLTHVPTGIVVQCQNDRSQHRNRDEAWQMLRARIYEHELRKQQAEQQPREPPHRRQIAHASHGSAPFVWSPGCTRPPAHLVGPRLYDGLSEEERHGGHLQGRAVQRR